MHIYGYSINSTVLDYECAIANENIDLANQLLPQIASSEYNEIASFLYSNDYIEYAYQIAQDPSLKFNYALELEDIDACCELLTTALNTDKEMIYNSQRWRRLADCCILKGNIQVAEECAIKANDLSLLLLLYTCSGNREGMKVLAEKAKQEEQWNISFLCYYLLQDIQACRSVLQEQHLLPQTAFFTLSHQPSAIQSVFKEWQEELSQAHHIAADLIANPSQYSEYFPGYQEALALEESIQPLYQMDIQASEYCKYKDMLETGLKLDELKCVGEEEVSEGEEQQEVNEQVNEEVSEEQVNEEVSEEQVNEQVSEEQVNEDEQQQQHNSPNPTESSMDEFDEIGEGSGGDVDDLDLDDLEKEWE